MNKNILVTVNNPWNIINFRMPLLRVLKEAGFNPIILVPAGPDQQTIKKEGYEVITLPLSATGLNPIKDFNCLWAYYRIMCRLRPAAMFSFTIKPALYGSLAARLSGSPIIVTITGLGATFIKENWVSWVVDKLYKLALPYASRVIFQNPDDRNLFLERGYTTLAGSELIPGSGVDTEHFASSPLPEPIGKSPVFLLIARLLRDKGVSEFVGAAQIVKKQYPESRFALLGAMGSGNPAEISKEELQQWLDEGYVEYWGTSKDVRHEISQATWVVLPSYREGLPRTLLEAASMGRPLIATDAPGCREVVKESKNGFLCKVKDTSSLAEIMLKACKLPADHIQYYGNYSRYLAETHFSISLVMSRYLTILHQMKKDTKEV